MDNFNQKKYIFLPFLMHLTKVPKLGKYSTSFYSSTGDQAHINSYL